MQRLHRLDKQGYNYILLVKPRQFGFTTDYAIDMLDDACWTPGISCAIIAHDRPTLSRIFQIIKRGYESMPREIRPIAQYDTKNEYKFTQRYDGVKLDSEIYVALELRGTTVQRLHISESAYIKDRDRMKQATKQTVPIGGRISEETTGNGMFGFYDDYMENYNKEKAGKLTPMDYKTFFYAWFQNPEYTLPGTFPTEISDEERRLYGDEAAERKKYNLTDGQLLWRRWKINELKSTNPGFGLQPLQSFKQEYPATMLEAFQSGLGNVFDGERLEAETAHRPLTMLEIADLLHANWEAKSAQEQEDCTNMRLQAQTLLQLGVGFWKLPEKNHHYTIGVDPSDGEGSDNTDIDVWCKECKEQVAQFYGKIRPDNGADLCKLIALFYNEAFVGVENNMLTFILELSKIYDNYYMVVEVDKKTLKRTRKLGFSTNTKTRDPMIDDYIAFWEDGALILHSSITIAEMKTFVKKDNGKREHADGKHDDSLFGGMIAIQMWKYEPRKGRALVDNPFNQ